MITYEEALQASRVFKGDLGLVGHPNDEPISPTSIPVEGYYAQTQLNGLGNEFNQIAKKPALLLIGCEDYRFAAPLYDLAKKNYPRFTIASILVAAGIAQDGSPERLQAMQTLVVYYLQELNVKQILATDHLHNCGGLNYIHDLGSSVCSGLGCWPGDNVELAYVKQKAILSARKIIPHWWQAKTSVEILTLEKKGEVKFA